MADSTVPLQKSRLASDPLVSTVEEELRALFVRLYAESLGEAANDITVYGAPHLGSFGLVERNIDADGLTVLRETTEARIRYLFKAWRHRNPERGLHFLRLYLKAIFEDRATIGQLWQRKGWEYPVYTKTEDEIRAAGESLSDYFLTSRVRVDVDSDTVSSKLLASFRSAVPARILLNVRIGKVASNTFGAAIVCTPVNVVRITLPNDLPDPPDPMFWLCTEDGRRVFTEGMWEIRTEGLPVYNFLLDGKYKLNGLQFLDGRARNTYFLLANGAFLMDGKNFMNGVAK